MNILQKWYPLTVAVVFGLITVAPQMIWWETACALFYGIFIWANVIRHQKTKKFPNSGFPNGETKWNLIETIVALCLFIITLFLDDPRRVIIDREIYP